MSWIKDRIQKAIGMQKLRDQLEEIITPYNEVMDNIQNQGSQTIEKSAKVNEDLDTVARKVQRATQGRKK